MTGDWWCTDARHQISDVRRRESEEGQIQNSKPEILNAQRGTLNGERGTPGFGLEEDLLRCEATRHFETAVYLNSFVKTIERFFLEKRNKKR